MKKIFNALTLIGFFVTGVGFALLDSEGNIGTVLSIVGLATVLICGNVGEMFHENEDDFN